VALRGGGARARVRSFVFFWAFGRRHSAVSELIGSDLDAVAGTRVAWESMGRGYCSGPAARRPFFARRETQPHRVCCFQRCRLHTHLSLSHSRSLECVFCTPVICLTLFCCKQAHPRHHPNQTNPHSLARRTCIPQCMRAHLQCVHCVRIAPASVPFCTLCCTCLGSVLFTVCGDRGAQCAHVTPGLSAAGFRPLARLIHAGSNIKGLFALYSRSGSTSIMGPSKIVRFLFQHKQPPIHRQASRPPFGICH